ncbi:MAG TPA: POTRA domain-containing protein [Candidatus Dormibacteraeota bacterium]|nr:POTRA domain-containing protein [Candidatus Dormibacteraeota bacterium]
MPGAILDLGGEAWLAIATRAGNGRKQIGKRLVGRVAPAYDFRMGRRKGNSLASAAALLGLLLAANVRAQQPPPQPQSPQLQTSMPRRCLPQPQSTPAIKLSIDSLQLQGTGLPDGVSQARFVAMLERRAGTGGSGWLDRVWSAAGDEWQDRGYARTVVNIQTLADSVQGGVRHVSLQVRVDPGPQYRVAEVRMLDVNPGGNLVFARQRLRGLIPLDPGERMNAGKLRQGVSALEKLYLSRGYIDLQVTPDLQIDDRQDTVSVFVMLDPGKLYRVGKIVALGFGAEGISMLKSQIKPGDVYDPNIVRHFYSRYAWLMPAGASVADDQVHRDAKTGTVDLLLDFRACPKPARAGTPIQAADKGRVLPPQRKPPEARGPPN